VSDVLQPRVDVNVSALLAGGGLEFGYQVGGHPAAVFYLDALHPGPLADLGGVQAAGWPARRLPRGRLAGAAADPAGSIHVPAQRIPRLLGVPGVQVDLIPGAVQPERDAALPSRSSMNRVCIF
jgi:hypothetical protein